MADDPLLDSLSPEVRAHIDLLLKKADSEGYFRAKLEDSAVRFYRPTVTQDPPAPAWKAGAAKAKEAALTALPPIRKAKPRKRGSGRGQAPRLVEDYFRAHTPTAATPKDVVLAIASERNVTLDFTQVRRALRALDEKGVVTKTGDKTWGLKTAVNGGGS